MKFITALCLLSCSLLASAAPLNRMIVFGDSLSDIGNRQIYTNQGGPIWVQNLASNLGINITRSTLGGNDFAYGGAETNGIGIAPVPTLFQQITMQSCGLCRIFCQPFQNSFSTSAVKLFGFSVMFCFGP